MRTDDFTLQSIIGPYWIDVLERLAAKDAIIAEKDAIIVTLQPDYVSPQPPSVASRVREAVEAVLSADELIAYDEVIKPLAVAVEARTEALEESAREVDPVIEAVEIKAEVIPTEK